VLESKSKCLLRGDDEFKRSNEHEKGKRNERKLTSKVAEFAAEKFEGTVDSASVSERLETCNRDKEQGDERSTTLACARAGGRARHR
jgi:hypothetical protein